MALVVGLVALIATGGILYDSVFGPSGEAAGTTIEVTTGGDGDPATPTTCTLRQAILSANGNTQWGTCTPGSGDDVVQISGSVSSPIQLGSEIAAGGVGALTIDGPGAANLDVRGGSGFRAFTVSAAPAVAISDLTISHGSVTDSSDARGGGVMVGTGANLTLERVAVTGNTATGEAAHGNLAGRGGGIYSSGTLTIRHSTVNDNTAAATLSVGGGGDYASAYGGGINHNPNSPLLIEESTIAGNGATATAGPGGGTTYAQAGGVNTTSGPGAVEIRRSTISGNELTASATYGGGIFTIAGGGTTLESDTITGNRAANDGANLRGSTVTFRNTLVANPLGGGPACGTTTSNSGGYNLEQGADTCGFDQATDQTGVGDAGLATALADNGGPTLTHALIPSSPAIDQGSAFGETADQRGLTRPVDFPGLANAAGGDGSDIGAFEFQRVCDEDTPGGTCKTAAPPTTTTQPPVPSGRRAAALKKCKKIKNKAKRKKCIRKAKKLPL